MADALAAEWAKLRSVRSTYFVFAVLGGVLALVALLSFQVAHLWDRANLDQRATVSVASLPEVAGWLAQLCLGVLGVLAISGEFSTGAIRGSLLAVPRRGSLFAAKALAVGTVALAGGSAVTLGAYAISHLVLGDRPIEGYVDDRFPLAVTSGLGAMVFALVAFGLATLMRNAAAAIATLVALWWLLPMLLQLLPATGGRDWAYSLLLLSLPRQAAGLDAMAGTYDAKLPPWAAFLVLAAYAAGALSAAALSFRRRPF